MQSRNPHSPGSLCGEVCRPGGPPILPDWGTEGAGAGPPSLPTAPYPELQVEGTSDGPSSPSRPLPPVSSAPAHHRQPYLSGTASCHLQAFAGHICPMPQCPNPSDHSGRSGPLSSSARRVGRSHLGTWPPRTSGSVKTTAAETANARTPVATGINGNDNRGAAARLRGARTPRQTRLCPAHPLTAQPRGAVLFSPRLTNNGTGTGCCHVVTVPCVWPTLPALRFLSELH